MCCTRQNQLKCSVRYLPLAKDRFETQALVAVLSNNFGIGQSITPPKAGPVQRPERSSDRLPARGTQQSIGYCSNEKGRLASDVIVKIIEWIGMGSVYHSALAWQPGSASSRCVSSRQLSHANGFRKQFGCVSAGCSACATVLSNILADALISSRFSSVRYCKSLGTASLQYTAR